MPQFEHIKAVLFDMDHTLIKHTWKFDEITTALHRHFERELHPITADEFFELFWSKSIDLWYMMMDGVIDGDDAQLYSYINTLRALEKDTSLAPQMVDTWRKLVLSEISLFDDTLSVLDTLRQHFTLGIVTNGFATMQRAKLNHYKLDDWVDFSLVSEEAKSHKPDTRIFELALEKAGNIAPNEAVFVGDNPNTDIKGAIDAGIHAVFIATNGATPPANVPIINRLSDLFSLLSIN